MRAVGVVDGRVAIVTGASRGIGEAVARRLAQEGAAVAVTARTQRPGDHPLPGSIEETAEAIRAVGGTALPVAADLSHSGDRHRLVEQTVGELGPVEILVNNAAVTYFQPTIDFPEKRYELMFTVQVRAPLELSQLVLPGMVERGRGWILNITSLSAVHPRPPYNGWVGVVTVYGMCKAALERFTTGLAAEMYEHGIAVNALAPSRVVPTPGAVHHHLIPDDPDQVEAPEVMAEAALRLVSGDPKELTGRIVYTAEFADG